MPKDTVLHPRTNAYTIIKVLITIKGTVILSVFLHATTIYSLSPGIEKHDRENLLLINVLTLDIKLTSFPLTLAASSLDPPNEGSVGVLPHPTKSKGLV